MPCVNSNGQPVPGAFGSCPIGSTWKDNVVPETEEERIIREDTPLQNVGDWFTPGGPAVQGAKWGLGALAASPFIKGGINYAKKKATDPNNLKRLQNLKNRLFKRFDEPVRPKHPIMNKSQEKAWRKANPGKWLYDKYKLAGWGGGTALSLTQLMQQMGDGDAQTTKPSGPQHMTDAQRMHQLDSSIPDKNAMQKLGDNMKDPKWWHQSMSGLKGDTRLMRLGQLMDYYGKTPKGRDASTSPAELWAANEVAHGKNVAAAAGGSNSTFLSKFNSEDQDLAIRKSVMDRLGFNDYVPFNQAGGEELEQTVARVKGLIQEFVEKGMPWSDALTLAMSYVEKE